MAPVRSRKRKSDHATAANNKQAAATTGEKIALKTTPTHQRSPIKKRKVGLTLAQKQALIDNLQLEITERARKLRAQYNLQAQGLRTRIEIRVNRIPMSLRKAKMGDIVAKHPEQRQRHAATAATIKPPPVPAKDAAPTRPASRPAPLATSPRAPKRSSDELSGGNKENEAGNVDNPKKRLRGGAEAYHANHAGQVLSPTSSNQRVAPRERPGASPMKSQIARPVSPTKPASMLTNMVEKAKATRGGAPTGTAMRKATTSSTVSSASTAPVATTARTRRAAAAAAATRKRTAPPTRPPTRTTTRRASGASSSSDASTSTVVKKPGVRAAASAAAAKKPGVMSTIRKGVASSTTRKTPAAKPAAPPVSTGRVLRKRN